MGFDLFELFVENVFGTLWMAIASLAFVQFLILALGGVSSYSMMLFVGIFLLAMTLGSGYLIVSVPIILGIVAWTVFQIKRYWEEQ